jgi:hypothetical protein
MSVLAAIRPDEWELPLFLHVLGALVLIGALALSAVHLFSAWRESSEPSLRRALRSITLGVIPAYLLLRVGAEWVADKEGYADLDKPPAWIDVGYIAADLGFVLIVVSSLIAWAGLRGSSPDGDPPTGRVRAAAILIALILLLNLVALWAMTTKPI